MSLFRFKQFAVMQDKSAMKVGTDGVLLGAWTNGTGAKKILDIGSGTGLIALMMAQRFDTAQVDAIEIDEHAFEQSLVNFIHSPFGNRIQGFHASLQEWLRYGDKKYDLIVCNPPYFLKGFQVEDLKRKKARDAGFLPAGLLIAAFQQITTADAVMSLILPVDEGEKLIELAGSSNIYCIRKTIVHSKPGRPAIRLLLAFSKTVSEIAVSDLVIENEEHHDYTEAYKTLTKDFYLKF